MQTLPPAPYRNGLIEGDLKSLSGAHPHPLACSRVCSQIDDRLRQPGAVAQGNGAAALMTTHEARDLPIRVADKNCRPAGGSDAIELARHDQPFELGTQRDEVHVRS